MAPTNLRVHSNTYFHALEQAAVLRAQLIDDLRSHAGGDALRQLSLAKTSQEFKDMLRGLLEGLRVNLTKIEINRLESAKEYSLSSGHDYNRFSAPSVEAPSQYNFDIRFDIRTIIPLGQGEDYPFFMLAVEGKDPNCLVSLLQPLFTTAFTEAVKNWEATGKA